MADAPCRICAHADRTGSWVDAPGFDGMTDTERTILDHARGGPFWQRMVDPEHGTLNAEAIAAAMRLDHAREAPDA